MTSLTKNFGIHNNELLTHNDDYSKICKICNRMFSKPLVLPCFHTFCKSCISSKFNVKTKTVFCVCCYDNINIECSIDDLLPNLSYKSLLKNLKENRLVTRRRIFCCKNNDPKTVAYCKFCQRELCCFCYGAHKTMSAFKLHQLVTIIKGDNNLESENDKCSIHLSENIVGVCLKCADGICKICRFNKHAKHSCKIFDSTYQTTDIDLISKIFENIKRKSMELENSLESDMKPKLKKLLLEQDNLENDLTYCYDYCLSLLKERFNELKRELDDIKLGKVNALKVMIFETEEHYEKLCEGKKFIESLFYNCGNRYELSLFKTLIEDRLNGLLKQEIQSFNNNNYSSDSLNLEFVSNLQSMETIIRNIFGYFKKTNDNKFVEKKESTNVTIYSDCSDEKTIVKENLSVQTVISTNTHPKPSVMKRSKMSYIVKFGEYGTLENQFMEPSGVAVDAENNIIVVDTNNHRIQVFDCSGYFKFQFGEYGKKDGQLLYPNRVAVIKDTGDIVLTERTPTHQVQIYSAAGKFIRKFGSSILQHPRGIDVDDNRQIIVVECKVMRVVIFDYYGNLMKKFNCSEYLSFPNGVVVSNKNNNNNNNCRGGEIFISDNRAHCVKVFNYEGEFLRELGGEGITNYPIGVMINRRDEIIIADNHNNFNLTVFQNDGTFLYGLESKVKHAQCFDVALMNNSDSVILASKDYRLYVYKYLQSF